jgi:hypothetical protein
VEEAVVDWRKKLSEQGLDAGVATIAVHLATERGSAPSTATCWPATSPRAAVPVHGRGDLARRLAVADLRGRAGSGAEPRHECDA